MKNEAHHRNRLSDGRKIDREAFKHPVIDVGMEYALKPMSKFGGISHTVADMVFCGGTEIDEKWENCNKLTKIRNKVKSC